MSHRNSGISCQINAEGNPETHFKSNHIHTKSNATLGSNVGAEGFLDRGLDEQRAQQNINTFLTVRVETSLKVNNSDDKHLREERPVSVAEKRLRFSGLEGNKR